MKNEKIKLLSPVRASLEQAAQQEISAERKSILQPLINYVQAKLDSGEAVNLNFICTHNSRRSQFSQIWAQAAADYYGIPIKSLSGGVEVTAFNERAVEAIKRNGFRVSSKGQTNPVYFVFNSDDNEPLSAFSKLYDDSANRTDKFAAVMTCSHADENCPFIPGTEKSISVTYEDPKAFDDTAEESEKYDERSLQIASEMHYVFSNIKY